MLLLRGSQTTLDDLVLCTEHEPKIERVDTTVTPPLVQGYPNPNVPEELAATVSIEQKADGTKSSRESLKGIGSTNEETESNATLSADEEQPTSGDEARSASKATLGVSVLPHVITGKEHLHGASSDDGIQGYMSQQSTIRTMTAGATGASGGAIRPDSLPVYQSQMGVSRSSQRINLASAAPCASATVGPTAVQQSAPRYIPGLAIEVSRDAPTAPLVVRSCADMSSVSGGTPVRSETLVSAGRPQPDVASSRTGGWHIMTSKSTAAELPRTPTVSSAFSPSHARSSVIGSITQGTPVRQPEAVSRAPADLTSSVTSTISAKDQLDQPDTVGVAPAMARSQASFEPKITSPQSTSASSASVMRPNTPHYIGGREVDMSLAGGPGSGIDPATIVAVLGAASQTDPTGQQQQQHSQVQLQVMVQAAGAAYERAKQLGLSEAQTMAYLEQCRRLNTAAVTTQQQAAAAAVSHNAATEAAAIGSSNQIMADYYTAHQLQQQQQHQQQASIQRQLGISAASTRDTGAAIGSTSESAMVAALSKEYLARLGLDMSSGSQVSPAALLQQQFYGDVATVQTAASIDGHQQLLRQQAAAAVQQAALAQHTAAAELERRRLVTALQQEQQQQQLLQQARLEYAKQAVEQHQRAAALAPHYGSVAASPGILASSVSPASPLSIQHSPAAQLAAAAAAAVAASGMSNLGRVPTPELRLGGDYVQSPAASLSGAVIAGGRSSAHTIYGISQHSAESAISPPCGMQRGSISSRHSSSAATPSPAPPPKAHTPKDAVSRSSNRSQSATPRFEPTTSPSVVHLHGSPYSGFRTKAALKELPPSITEQYEGRIVAPGLVSHAVPATSPKGGGTFKQSLASPLLRQTSPSITECFVVPAAAGSLAKSSFSDHSRIESAVSPRVRNQPVHSRMEYAAGVRSPTDAAVQDVINSIKRDSRSTSAARKRGDREVAPHSSNLMVHEAPMVGHNIAWVSSESLLGSSSIGSDYPASGGSGHPSVPGIANLPDVQAAHVTGIHLSGQSTIPIRTDRFLLGENKHPGFSVASSVADSLERKWAVQGDSTQRPPSLVSKGAAQSLVASKSANPLLYMDLEPVSPPDTDISDEAKLNPATAPPAVTQAAVKTGGWACSPATIKPSAGSLASSTEAGLVSGVGIKQLEIPSPDTASAAVPSTVTSVFHGFSPHVLPSPTIAGMSPGRAQVYFSPGSSESVIVPPYSAGTHHLPVPQDLIVGATFRFPAATPLHSSTVGSVEQPCPASSVYPVMMEAPSYPNSSQRVAGQSAQDEAARAVRDLVEREEVRAHYRPKSPQCRTYARSSENLSSPPVPMVSASSVTVGGTSVTPPRRSCMLIPSYVGADALPAISTGSSAEPPVGYSVSYGGPVDDEAAKEAETAIQNLPVFEPSEDDV